MKSASRLWAKNLALVSLAGLLLFIAGCGGGGTQTPGDENRQSAETPISTAIVSHEDTIISFVDGNTGFPTGVSLGIPAGALDFDEDVTIRLFQPETEAIPSPLEDHEMVSVYRFETDPPDFQFNFDVTVNMPVTGGDSHLIVYELEDWVFPPDPTSEVIPAPTGDGPPQAPRDLWARPDDGFCYLTWTPNLEPDIAGYNVYRANVGGPLALVNPELITGTSYMDDSGISNGLEYWYMITAVDSEDPANESPFSDGDLATPGNYWDTVSIARVAGTQGSFPVFELGTYAIMRRTEFPGMLDIDMGYSLNNDFTPVGVEFYCSVFGASAGTLYLWDFDDGSPLSYLNTQQNPTHTYTVAGTYYPSVTVNNFGIEEMVTIGDPVAEAGGIDVSDAGDVVKFFPQVEIFQPTPPGPHEFLTPKTQLFAATAIDLDGTIDSYWWDFGDGSPTVPGAFDSVTGFYTVEHTFDGPGCTAYETSFHAIDNGGSEGVDSVNMQINPIPPITPTGFSIVDVSTDYIPWVELAWDSVASTYPDFDIRYRLYINDLDPADPAFQLEDTTFTFDEDAGAVVGDLFRFSIASFYECTPDTDLQSGLALPPLSITIQDTTPPEPPTGLGGSVPVTAPSTVVLTWTASVTPDVNHYKVYRIKNNPGGSPPFDPVTLGGWDDITAEDLDDTDTAFVDGIGPDGIPGANGHTTFCYVVTAVDNAGNESFTASSMPCLVPQGVVPYVLLVDNTGERGANNDDVENFEHRQALIDLGLTDGEDFEMINTYEYDEDDPDERDRLTDDLRLGSRDLVIWFTSDSFRLGDEAVVTQFEIDLLEDYLDGGGKLIMDGDDVAYSLSLDGWGQNFLEDYFSIDTDEIDDEGAADDSDVEGITGSIYNGWSTRRGDYQGFEDSFEVDVTGGGLEALAVNGWPMIGYEVIGVQKHDTGDDFYTLFMSIGLEDFLNDLEREEWLRKAFNYMEVDLP